ncbi:helix-turn-helix domain-containing protein [Kitasatospora sp. NPDC005856]|uniref:helix-turn-helix domain-containing protein n=1 Tax=Kitasatospora sp. NPDC005856 TaxID=3154566 RepID=UPI0033E10870
MTMDRETGMRELAAALTRLKDHSGLSYQELARRTFTSRTTLHRYCTGQGIPGGYDVIARFARECGARPDELNALLRSWQAVTGEATTVHTESGAGPGPGPGAEPAPPPAAEGLPPRRATRRSGRHRAAVALAALSLLAGTAAGSIPAGTSAPSRLPVAAPAAASWADAPVAVARTAFGVTLNSSSGATPTFRVGSVRLWDSETRWSQLEPRRGVYDWSTLDRLLQGTGEAGLPTLFVFGGTPGWAAPGARRAAYPEDSRAAPPDDLADWDAFVSALVEHARGRIEAYELWVMANHPHHFNGPTETLVEMARRASRIIRAGDPGALVVCPSVTGLWEPSADAFVRRFAELGGYQDCDAAGVKLYQRRIQDPPETMLEAVQSAYRSFHQAGVHLPLWNTGTTQTLPLNDPLDPQRAANHAVRFYLTGLYGRRYGLERMYFYAWGNSTLPIVLQPEGRPPTTAALYVERLQHWLAEASLTGCGRGAQAALPENVWQCEFTVPVPGGPSLRVVVLWTDAGAAETTVGPRRALVHDLDSGSREVDGQHPLRITERPVLVTYG